MIPEGPPLFSYTHTLRSRYSETDQMGYVYYGRYLEYFEVARTEMIRSLGLPYAKMEQQGIMLPVVESHVQYKAPVFYDALMSVSVLIFDVPTARLTTFYQLHTHDGKQLHALGKVELCFMNAKSRKPRRAPADFVDRLKNNAKGQS